MKLKVSLQKTILKKSVKNYFITLLFASTVESLKKNKFVTGKKGKVLCTDVYDFFECKRNACRRQLAIFLKKPIQNIFF